MTYWEYLKVNGVKAFIGFHIVMLLFVVAWMFQGDWVRDVVSLVCIMGVVDIVYLYASYVIWKRL